MANRFNDYSTGHSVDFAHFVERVCEGGKEERDAMTPELMMQRLRARITSTNGQDVRMIRLHGWSGVWCHEPPRQAGLWGLIGMRCGLTLTPAPLREYVRPTIKSAPAAGKFACGRGRGLKSGRGGL